MRRPIAFALTFALTLTVAFAFAWSGVALGQAEPAPESYRPPREPGMPQPSEPQHREEQAKLPKWHISIAPHLNLLLGGAPSGLPIVGYGGGVQVTRALVPLGRSRFGVGADFGYDRFSHQRSTSAFTSGTQYLAHATFAALLVLDGIFGRVRPWFALGGGLSVASYQDPVSTSGGGQSRAGVAGLVKVAAGLGVRVYESFDIGLRADMNATLSSENVNGKDIWQPGFFSLGLDLGFRF